MTSEARASLVYMAAAINMVVGVYILVDAYAHFASDAVTPVNYFVRGVGPLIIGAVFVILARHLRAQNKVDDA